MPDAMRADKRADDRDKSRREDGTPDGDERGRRNARSGSDLSGAELEWVSGGTESSEEEPWSPGHYILR
jgi:hypothetical protein